MFQIWWHGSKPGDSRWNTKSRKKNTIFGLEALFSRKVIPSFGVVRLHWSTALDTRGLSYEYSEMASNEDRGEVKIVIKAKQSNLK